MTFDPDAPAATLVLAIYVFTMFWLMVKLFERKQTLAGLILGVVMAVFPIVVLAR